jgi:O-succinylbenzoic acid--CoA ligase
VAGVQVLFRSVVSGTTPVLFEGSFAHTGVRVHGRSFVSLVPTQLVRLLEAGGEPARALASFDAVLLGGAAASPSLLRRAADAGVRVVTTYGMSETCGGCVYDGVPLDEVSIQLADERPADVSSDAAPGQGRADEEPAAALPGRPGEGPALVSADPARLAAPPEGRVRLGGPVVARGYRLRPDAAEFVCRDGERWFVTSDVGTVDAEGRLAVLGRMDDVIISGGVNVAPQQVEGVIGALSGVRECLVVGVPDERWGRRVVVLVVPDGAGAPTREAVRAVVKSGVGAAAAPHDVLVVEAIPAAAVGKPDRRAAAALARRLVG